MTADIGTLHVDEARAPRATRRLPAVATWQKLLLLAVATLLVLYYRRPDQFMHPAVWVEDGRFNILDYAEHGWLSLLHPIQGYFSLPIKFLHALAETLSFRWLPEIGMWLSVLFTYGVLAAIATAPTTLRLPFLCALVTLLIPTDSEVFAVSLYSGFWGSLLAVLPLFWRETGKTYAPLRYGMVVVGGLSSPLIIALAPIYALHAALVRTRQAYISTALCAAASIAQLYALRTMLQLAQAGKSLDLSLTIEKMFGYFVALPQKPGVESSLLFCSGLAIVLLIAFTGWSRRRELGLTLVILAGVLAVAIIATIVRVPIDAIHPKLAGPRYFFFSYTFLSWILVQIVATRHAVASVLAVVVLLLGLRNTLDIAQRRHTAIDWRINVEECLRKPRHSMPVHLAGYSSDQWNVSLSADQCSKLVQQSWFDNKVSL